MRRVPAGVGAKKKGPGGGKGANEGEAAAAAEEGYHHGLGGRPPAATAGGAADSNASRVSEGFDDGSSLSHSAAAELGWPAGWLVVVVDDRPRPTLTDAAAATSIVAVGC